jgi:hypothetical protein
MAERDGVDALAHQGLEAVLDEGGVAIVAKAARDLSRQADRPVASRSSGAPPFEVTSPPSNAPTTWRPAKPSKTSCVELQSVSIGRAFLIS